MSDPRTVTPRPTVGALFAGYGGIELAVHDVLDAEPAWFVEFDKAPSKVLVHHWPDIPNYGDVTTVGWASVEPVDIITGGSPCQDLSHAGKRAGMKAGTRSGLWASMCDAIDIIRPQLVIWENVRGALSAPADSAVEPCPLCVGDAPGVSLRALGRVLGDLAELGYDAAWYGLRAADVGAPHGRWRVFVLAWPADDTSIIDALPGAGRVGGNPAVLKLLPTPEAKLGSSGADFARATRPGAGGDSLHEAVARLLPTPRATDGTKGGPNQRGSSGDLMLPSAVRLMPTPMATDAKGARNSTASRQPGSTASIGDTLGDLVYRGDFGPYAAAIDRWESVLGRPAPAPTEPTGKASAHRLSPRFVEWLMGLPDGHVTDPAIGISRNDQLKALGNGVVPQQCAAALRHLLTIRNTAIREDVAA